MASLTPLGGDPDQPGDFNSRVLTAVARQNTPAQGRGTSATPNPSRLGDNSDAQGSMRGSPSRSPNRRQIGSAGYDAGSSRGANLSRFNAGLRGEDEKRLDFEKFKSEARTRATAGKYDQAIELYTKALQLKSDHAECLLARAICYHELSEYAKSLRDTEAALKVNPNHAKANHIKGEAHYQKGEFEYALVYFHRAKKLRPGVVEYDRDIKKAEGAIEASIGATSGAHLSIHGDITYFENQKAIGDRSVELLVRQTSAQRRVALARHDRRGADRSRDRDAKTVKQLLEELYGDWKYLDDLLADEDRLLDELDDEEKEEEQKRKRLIKEKRDALKGGNPLKQVEEDDDKLVPKDNFSEGTRKKRRHFCQKIRGYTEHELTYLNERAEFWMQQKPPANKNKSPKDSEAKDILRRLESIEDDLTSGRHDDSLRRARKLLKEINESKTLKIKRRYELLSTTHSLLGCSYYEMMEYGKAIEQHKKDLKLTEEGKNKQSRSRALDNLGRTYAKKGDFTNAIQIFAQKIPMVTSTLESTWLYHELGRCYLETGKYAEAQSCAEKSVVSANETDDRAWQLNANVLMAQSEVELKNYSSALDAFEKALTIARIDDDDEAKAVITKAIADVNKKIGDTDGSRTASSSGREIVPHVSTSRARSRSRSPKDNNSLIKSPKDTKRSPSPKDNKRPPSPKGEKGTPSPKGEKRTPSPKGGKRAPSPKGRKKTPSPKGGKRTPSPKSGKRTTSPKGGKRTPSPKGGKRTPSPKGGKRTPSPKGGTRTPSPKGGKRTPSPKGGKRTPSPKGGKRTPSPKGGKRTPSPKGGKRTPSPKGGKRTPSPKGGKRTPSPKDGK